MKLTNAQQSEITYLKHRISLNEEKMLEITTQSRALLPEAVKGRSIPEYIDLGFEFGELKDNIQEWKKRIASIEGLNN